MYIRICISYIYIYTYISIYYKKTDPPFSACESLDWVFFICPNVQFFICSNVCSSPLPLLHFALPCTTHARPNMHFSLQMRALLHIRTFPHCLFSKWVDYYTLHYTATHCNTLQHPATHRTNCNYEFFPKCVLFSTYTPFSTASFPNVKSTIWREKTCRSRATWRKARQIARARDHCLFCVSRSFPSKSWETAT